VRLLTTQIDDTKVKTIIIGDAYLERTKSEKSNRFLCIIGAKDKVLLTFFLHPKMKGSSLVCLSGVHRQYRPRAFAAGRPETRDVQMDAALHRNDPLRPLSPEIFMRDYYEPRLLPRLLGCYDAETRGDPDECGRAFKPVRPLAQLNRIQPNVRIVRCV
jgi:hypothetical protein